MMKNYRFAGASIFLLFVAGCSKEIKTPTVATTERYADAGAGDLDVLGYGYDIQGEYAHSASKTRKVIDVQKMREQRPGKIDVNFTNRSYFEMRSGSDFKEYNKSYTIDWGASASGKIFGIEMFSSELKGKFSGSETSSSTYSFATVDYLIQKKIVSLFDDDYDDIMQNFLTSEFKNDCNTLSASALLNRYGAVVLKKIKLGGKLNANYRSQVNSGSKRADVEAGAKAGFKVLFNVDVHVESSISSGSKYNNSNQLLKYETVGGSAGHTILGQSTLGSGTTTININNWSSSVTNDNAELIGLYEDSYIPLYKLIPNLDKARSVRSLIFRNIIKGKEKEYFGDLVGDLISLYTGDDEGEEHLVLLKIQGNKFLIIADNLRGFTSYTYKGQSYAELGAFVNNDRVNYYFSPNNYLMFNPEVRDHFLPYKAYSSSYWHDFRQNIFNNRNELCYYEDRWDVHRYYMTWFTGNFIYDGYNRKLSLVIDQSTGKKYLNIDYFSENVLYKKVLYPFSSEQIIDVYKFNRSKFTNIPNTSGYEVREAI